MGDKTSEQKLSPDIAVAIAVKKWWPWLSDLLCKKYSVEDVHIVGFVARQDGPTWIMIVRGFNTVTWSKVVCFGSGEGLYEAMRNVSLAVAKRQWRKDKY